MQEVPELALNKKQIIVIVYIVVILLFATGIYKAGYKNGLQYMKSNQDRYRMNYCECFDPVEDIVYRKTYSPTDWENLSLALSKIGNDPQK